MKKIILLLAIIIPSLLFAQNSKDIHTVIQKTIDLHVLKQYYNEKEKAGEVPLIIINDGKIPNNLIVFKFEKQVAVMTKEELVSFKSTYKGDMDSFFIFEILEFNNDEAIIKANFRKKNRISIDVNMKKENDNWLVIASKAEH